MLRINESNTERALRILLGLFLLLGSMLLFEPWHWMAGAMGLILFVTGLTGFCPLYRLKDITTL
jgi:hypothetical protein